MICPECGSEYREGFTRCRACDVDLVEPVQGEPDVQLVRVYAGTNPALVPLVESLLVDADIEFMKRFEGVQDLFAFGRALGVNQVVDPVEFWVRTEDVERARELLGGVDESVEEPGADESLDADDV